jgi:hypothetical protein
VNPAKAKEQQKMSQDKDFENNPVPLVDVVAENMAIYAGAFDDQSFRPQAEQLLRSFEAIEGRPAADYLEIEQWSLTHQDQGGRFLVLPGGKE